MHTFPKSERLCLQKQINRLFTEGKSFLVYPYKVIYYLDDESPSRIQVAISVSKKYSKRAVKRNRMKRLTREAYRLNKSLLHEYLSSENKKLITMFVYVGKEEYEFAYIHQKMQLVLKKLMVV
ncbi:MAG: ribonuclease P protein component [Bacteroidales bacterium]|nr:ribonuclease P protein component [Bacteroidales bacterium]